MKAIDRVLLQGVMERDASQVGTALRAGADPGLRVCGMGLLHLCAIVGEPECTALLVGHGAPVDGRADDGMTPVMYAAMFARGDGGRRIIGSLIDAGADLCVAAAARTPLGLAAEFDNRAAVDLMRAAGASVHANERTSWVLSLLEDAGSPVRGRDHR